MPSGSSTKENPGSPLPTSPGPPEPQGLTAEDAHRHLGLLRELVEIESPSYSPGVARVAQVMARELEGLGAGVTVLEGGHLSAELGGTGPALLLIGHTDTVWPEGTLESMPFRVEGAHAFGPGVYDMKAGLVLLVEAIRLAGDGRRALRVFLTADEELGSSTGRAWLEAAADEAAAALVVEPPTPEGHLKTARKGLGRFRFTITGRPSHAGTHRHEGVSAIEELAHQILALHALNDEERGISVNVGVVQGGTTENVVAAEASAHVDVRITSAADQGRVERALQELQPVLAGATIELGGGWTRPPLERSPGGSAMFEQARAYGRELGLDLLEASTGGGSDGNIVGAAGVPVLDGLGAEGGGAHALNEHVVLDSISVRAELLARLLRNPGI
jgi:glutamate carboxypeptidase